MYTPENENISPDEPTSDDDSVIDVNISPSLLHMIKIPPEMLKCTLIHLENVLSHEVVGNLSVT